MVEFGELKEVGLRQAWPHEAHNFTPWLAENLDKLAQAIGGPHMELVATEMAVEQFSADIVARYPDSGNLVLIENQLEWTDHTHLGQVLTYLAGTEAHTVIWIAREFTNPHLSALRWLNEHTVAPYAFFAVRVKVVQIGDSPLAPLFEVLERPNDWDRQIRVDRESGEPSGIQQFRQNFWEFYNRNYPGDMQRWYPGYRNRHAYINIDGLVVGLAASQVEVGHYLSDLRSGKDPETRRRYNYVVEQFGEVWDRRSFEYCTNPENWGEMAAWLHDALEKYRKLIDESATAASESPAEPQS